MSVPSGPQTTFSRAVLYGLLAALLFGFSTPASKLLLQHTSPVVLAALLYLGAGIALSLARIKRVRSVEAPLRRNDLPVLGLMIAAGGVAGPLLLLTGLERLSGVAGSLLLNLEMPLTVILAVLFFREHVGRKEAAAIFVIAVGAACLGLQPGETDARADGWGIAAVVGAGLAWAVDNNLTARLSLRDPVAVTQVKTLGAGICSSIGAFVLGETWPPLGVSVAALSLGMLSYGLSLVLHLRAVRVLGAARQAAYFATGPFAGAVLSALFLHEPVTGMEVLAGLLIAAGVLLLFRATHSHHHIHAALVHEHMHHHDAHHDHPHEGDVSEPHVHIHSHEAMGHAHPHASDAHHLHSHK